VIFAALISPMLILWRRFYSLKDRHYTVEYNNNFIYRFVVSLLSGYIAALTGQNRSKHAWFQKIRISERQELQQCDHSSFYSLLLLERWRNAISHLIISCCNICCGDRHLAYVSGLGTGMGMFYLYWLCY
jgi:hypothetical protein